MVTLSNRVPGLSLADCKAVLRITSNSQDAYIQSLIDAATEEALSLSGHYFGTVEATFSGPFVSELTLPIPKPVISISSVKVDDATLSGGDWEYIDGVLSISVPGERLTVVYSAGYADPPADALLAIAQNVRFQYDFADNPEMKNPRFFDRVIGRYKEPELYTAYE